MLFGWGDSGRHYAAGEKPACEKVAFPFAAWRGERVNALALIWSPAALDGVTVNGPAPREGAPQIVSASFEGLRSEVLLHALEEEQIYVSAGSACGSAHPEDNRTLYAIGLRGEKLVSTLRFSLSIYTTEEEIDRTLEVLRAKLPLLRRFVRR